MAVPKQWKIIGAATVAAGLGVGAVAAAEDDGTDGSGRIGLRDRARSVSADAPESADDRRDDRRADRGDDRQASPDGESLDSPFQSPNDSFPNGFSFDSPGDAPPPPPPPVPAPAPPPPAPAPPPPPPPPRAGGRRQRERRQRERRQSLRRSLWNGAPASVPGPRRVGHQATRRYPIPRTV